MFSSGGPIGQIHFVVGSSQGCDLLIRRLPRSLRRIRVTWSGSGLPQASMGRNRARPSPPSHFVRVGPAPDTGPGHGSAHPSRRTRRGERRRGALLAGVPAGLNPSHTARHRDCPARPGPAGRPEHHQRAGRWAQN